MYPQGARRAHAELCRGCHLHPDACLCDQQPSLATRARFQLLVHPRELDRPTNTGHLVVNALESSRYHIWSRRQPPRALLEALAEPQWDSYLVFPAGLPPTSPAPPAALPERRQFVILDATWQEARKMLRQSPYLACLPRLSLPPDLRSRYSLRRHQPAGHLATAEVAVALLRLGSEASQALALDRYYQAFLHHFCASRSGHGLRQ
ncbi:DTW domain-containing protein [Exilibacterium tricleocarpae]|uniref:tRNA-uridine aminocarboxypropyltransferase n=1 Tax=Exilibacterium tricleocarpae TaxID=2591008 RepID=A0A545SPM4_9GAMM|nr:DTW domain-containing protein [Exilibacterium tricleocarpae]TQV66935.1 DTW domain-containing protein [Exilibacterium tricleocarpae]